MPFSATGLDIEIIILNEVKSDKNKYHMISFIYGIWKNDTNKLLDKINGLADIENKTYGFKGESIGGD